MGQTSTYHQTSSQLEAEAKLINKAKQNPKDFEPLYNRYYEQIFRFVYQRSPDIETAKDITSQIFLKAVLNINRYTFMGVPFSSWLYRIAVSETNKYYRDQKKERSVFVTPEFIAEDLEASDFEDDSTKLNNLKNALNNLDHRSLQLIELRFFEKRSVREVAEILDISETNAKVRCHRAVSKLKKMYQKTQKS